MNTLTEPTGVLTQPSDITNLFCGALNWLFWGLIVLSIAMFLIGGYLYVTSGGDGEKVSKATKTLTYAAIGVVIALVAQGVPIFISSILGSSASLNACTVSSAGTTPNVTTNVTCVNCATGGNASGN